MRGHYEEAPAVTTLRELERAARRYAGLYLAHGFGGLEVEAAHRRLAECAVAFADAQKPAPKKKRATLAKGPAR